MNENGTKRREWVKTAAIIFLSVMLVLTFFAQTIMNYSLPEVATQYVQSGSITAKIRGTGTVESGDPYEVKVTESRKVSSVAVTVGSEVQKGDVLFYLEDADSDELKAARDELAAAQEEYELALLTESITSSDIYSANKDISAASLRQQITRAQAAVTEAKNAAAPFEEKLAELNQRIADIEAQLDYEDSQDRTAESRVSVAASALKTATENKTNAENAYYAALQNVKNKQDALDQATVSGNDTTGPADELKKAEADRDSKYTAFKNAETAETNARNEWNAAVQNDTNRQNSQTKNNLTSQKDLYKLEKYGVEKDLAAAKELVAQREQELTDLIGRIGNIANLEAKLDKIERAQKKVDELTEKAIGATITADIAGTVTAVNVTAGNTTSAAVPVAVLQPAGKGYTMSFSVTNEQAKRLSVGDRADLVNAWWYNDVDVTLSSIKPDRNNPGQMKQLTFDVTGSVTAGQTLNVSVGQKSANYDLIVPNSAVREDSNGKFILIVESKSSPLGNRYIATRVDIEVIASDDTQSAISGALYGYEYVITTSTKPVEAGKQVRLAD